MRLTYNEQIKAEFILKNLIQSKTPISYSEFAFRLELTGHRKINRVLKWLEQITLEDVITREPIRASMIFSKLTPGLPSPGYFDFCKEIGLFDWKKDPSEGQKFINSQQKALFSSKKAYK